MLTTLLKSLSRVGRSRARTILLAVLGVATATTALAIYAVAQSTPPSLQDLFPKDSEAIGSVRADWLWSTTSSIRSIPAVSKAIAQAEQQSGLNVDEDIVPWAGRIGVAAFDLTDKSGDVVFYAEIRDTGKFMATLAKVQAKLQQPSSGKGPQVQFTTHDYHGVTVYALQPAAGPAANHPVSFAILNSWAIAAVGKGAIEHALDVYQGRSPSLTSNPNWSPVLSQLPPDAQAWGAVDPGAIMESVDPTTIKVKGPANATLHTCYGGAFVDEGTGMRFSVIGAPETSAGKAVFAQFARNLKPVTPQILNRVPDGVLAGIITNPAYIYQWTKSAVLDSAPGPKERKQALAGLKQAAPYLEPLQYFHKDAGLVITWRKDRGFGLVILAQSDSHDAALHAAKSVVNDLKQTGIPLQRGGNSWIAAIPGLDMMVPPTVPVKLSPFISAKDDWLVIGSNPSWTAPQSTPPALHLPEGSQGASTVGILSMRFLPAVFSLIDQNVPADNTDAHQALDLARGLHLEGSTWTMFGTYAPDGRSSSGEFAVTGWDWHAAIDSTIKAVENWKPSTPAKGHDLLKKRPDMTKLDTPSLHS